MFQPTGANLWQDRLGPAYCGHYRQAVQPIPDALTLALSVRFPPIPAISLAIVGTSSTLLVPVHLPDGLRASDQGEREEKVDPSLRWDDGLGIGLLSPSHADRTRIRN